MNWALRRSAAGPARLQAKRAARRSRAKAGGAGPPRRRGPARRGGTRCPTSAWRPERSRTSCASCASVPTSFGGTFDVERKRRRLTELEHLAGDPTLWQGDRTRVEEMLREKRGIERDLEFFT